MNELIFATGNSRKIKEATLALALVNVEIKQQKIDIEEIQNKDGKKVTEHKAAEAYKILRCPPVVNDTYWTIPALNGFPGPYMKDIDSWFAVEDWQRLLKEQNRSIICHENVVFVNAKGKLHWFGKQFKGIFVDKPKGKNIPKNSTLEKLISFDGGCNTLASLHDEENLPFDPQDYCWADFAKWYKTKFLIK